MATQLYKSSWAHSCVM